MNFPTNVNEILPWTLSGWRLMTLLVSLLFLMVLIFWAYSGGKSEIPLITNIGVDQGKNSIQANLVTNKEKEVNNAANVTNGAINALNNSISRPSNQFDGNRANDRYCRDFPGDCR